MHLVPAREFPQPVTSAVGLGAERTHRLTQQQRVGGVHWLHVEGVDDPVWNNTRAGQEEGAKSTL